jgi:small subunit ribosomal protein S4
VNGDVVNIASTTLNLGIRLLFVKSKSLDAIERSLSNSSHVYEWITWNNGKEGTFVSVPARLQIQKTLKNS